MAELWPGGPIELPHDFVLDGETFTLPEVNTAALFGHLAYGAWWELVPNALADDERVRLAGRLADEDDPLEFEHLWQVGTTLAARLAGTTVHGHSHGWHSAHRVASTVAQNWIDYVAWCAAHGQPPLAGSLWQIIGGGLACLRESHGSDEKDRRQLEARLFAPGPQPVTVPRHTAEDEALGALAILEETLPGEVPGGFPAEAGVGLVSWPEHM